MNPDFLVSDGGDDSIHDDLRKWRKVDDVDGLRMRLQRALKTAETVMYADGVDPETRLSAARAVVSAAREARKAVEAHELQERVEQLERVVKRDLRHLHSNGSK